MLSSKNVAHSFCATLPLRPLSANQGTIAYTCMVCVIEAASFNSEREPSIPTVNICAVLPIMNGI